eukprot:TRINITY_DN17362_c0_g1_i1.p1 TRINITY_DN17362_c0_g1~~TRINITY_DN17362_c0_g1_i1.p1  ORF type:complete len:233 (+),score=41.60 TRINITY_DN17362_c0_g1_i1:76-774(+)
MRQSKAWRAIAWKDIGSPGAKIVLDKLKEMEFEPRVVGPQDKVGFKEFVDKAVGWGVQDDATRVRGESWRSRLGREAPNTDIAPGKRSWNIRELTPDIPTPPHVSNMYKASTLIGLYSRQKPDEIIGALSYSKQPGQNGVLQMIAVAPNVRRQSAASLLILGMLEDMRVSGCHMCTGTIPSAEHLAKPWLASWLNQLSFEEVERQRDGLQVGQYAAFEGEGFVERMVGGDDE